LCATVLDALKMFLTLEDMALRSDPAVYELQISLMSKIRITPLIYRVTVRIKENKKIVYKL
jgi:hypothetical protein